MKATIETLRKAASLPAPYVGIRGEEGKVAAVKGNRCGVNEPDTEEEEI